MPGMFVARIWMPISHIMEDLADPNLIDGCF